MMPCSTCIWWFSRGWFTTLSTDPAAPAFGSAAAIHQPVNARVDHRPRAHRARLQGHVKRDAVQPIIPQRRRRAAQRNNLRMRGGIVCAQNAILSPRNDFAVVHGHRANRHFAGIRPPAALLPAPLP